MKLLFWRKGKKNPTQFHTLELQVRDIINVKTFILQINPFPNLLMTSADSKLEFLFNKNAGISAGHKKEIRKRGDLIFDIFYQKRTRLS